MAPAALACAASYPRAAPPPLVCGDPLGAGVGAGVGAEEGAEAEGQVEEGG